VTTRSRKDYIYQYVVGRERSWNVVSIDYGELTKVDDLETCAGGCNE
jgi:hypothetical protein